MDKEAENKLIRDELRFYGLSAEDAELIRSKEGITVLRICTGEGPAVLKCFGNTASRRELDNYDILINCGVPTIRVLGKSGSSILIEDICASTVWRLGEERDLNDPAVVRAIAKWYRTLHLNGEEYVRSFGGGMYEEWDCVTKANIDALQAHFGLYNNKGLNAAKESFALLRKRMDEAPRTLAYNDFYYTNMAVKKDASEALMFDYDLLGKGCCASDLRNVVYWFSEENRELFFSVYGEADESLLLLDRICAPIVSLVSAMDRGIFPGWAKEAVEDLDGLPRLLEKL